MADNSLPDGFPEQEKDPGKSHTQKDQPVPHHPLLGKGKLQSGIGRVQLMCRTPQSVDRRGFLGAILDPAAFILFQLLELPGDLVDLPLKLRSLPLCLPLLAQGELQLLLEIRFSPLWARFGSEWGFFTEKGKET